MGLWVCMCDQFRLLLSLDSSYWCKKKLLLKCGVLVVMVLDLVHASVVTSTVALKVDITIQELLMFKQVGHILFVLLVFIVAALESVLHVRDVTLTSTDVTSPTSVQSVVNLVGVRTVGLLLASPTGLAV